MGRLTTLQVKALKKPGRHTDGDGLLLEIKPSGAKSWIARLQFEGRRRDYGLGSVKGVSLEEARELARQYRRTVRAGRDPSAERRVRAQRMPTFETAARAVFAEQKSTWRNQKHRAQWLSTLEAYVFPFIGSMPVNEIETGHVRDLLARIWLSKEETSRRVRQRIGAVLDYAHGKGWRSSTFPMTAVNRALPKQRRGTEGHKALPYNKLPTFMAGLRGGLSTGRLAVEALILTVARSGEIRGATWDEIDLEAGTWSIPAARMKGKKKHRVPLSSAAKDVFSRADKLRSPASNLVFPGMKRGRPLSDMTLLKVVRDAGLDVTVHGFRSCFRDWCAETTNTPREVAEAVLAHTNPDRVESAYLRTEHYDKRVPLMEEWGQFCLTGSVQLDASTE